MKIIITDKADKQHDLDDIILEFAGLHASASLTFQSILKRLEDLEHEVGIEPDQDIEAVNDADLEPADSNKE
jgi:hypothetical protein